MGSYLSPKAQDCEMPSAPIHSTANGMMHSSRIQVMTPTVGNFWSKVLTLHPAERRRISVVTETVGQATLKGTMACASLSDVVRSAICRANRLHVPGEPLLCAAQPKGIVRPRRRWLRPWLAQVRHTAEPFGVAARPRAAGHSLVAAKLSAVHESKQRLA